DRFIVPRSCGRLLMSVRPDTSRGIKRIDECRRERFPRSRPQRREAGTVHSVASFAPYFCNPAFCYDSTMRLSLHRFLAYVLLLLLPLQTIAAGAAMVCPPVNSAGMLAEVVMEECDGSVMMHSSTKTLAQHDSSPHSGQDAHDKSAPCGMSSGCMAFATIAVLPQASEWRIAAVFSPIGFADHFYLSHIPEGLQRPPQVS
ncbi:hypothetical protein, partial [Noviherbaspirillum sp.]|uniref:hypothetical protein n=1 Tax=Noviherbaspirillum sp. TaxID=1926288 RepID=UPI002FE08D90